jgi:hypothetical protein
MYKLLTDSNPKTSKSIEFGYLTAILHLAPHKLSGKNLCPKASKGCIETCLNTAGHGQWDTTQKARVRRSKLFMENPTEFYQLLYADIEKLKRQAEKLGLKPCLRLNGTSDIPKLALKVARDFPELQVYDYTKILDTLKRSDLPTNYHLTFSRTEDNLAECLQALSLGFNVAAVFHKLPDTFHGFDVIDGDIHDLRFLDSKKVIVGLKAKGKARQDITGFVAEVRL